MDFGFIVRSIPLYGKAAQLTLIISVWAVALSLFVGYSVGVTSLGDQDTIAPAVKKGDKELLDWVNNELTTLGKENFVHAAYDATLKPAYGDSVSPEDVVIEGGKIQ